MKILRNQKGVSLIEIVVGILVSAVVFVTINSIFFLGNNLVKSANSNTYGKLIGDTVFNLIEDSIVYAGDVFVEVNKNNTSTNGNYFLIKNGRFIQDGKDPFDTAFYNGYSLALNAQILENNIVEIEIKVYDSDKKECYSIKQSVRNINAQLNKLSITQTSKINNCVLSFKPFIFEGEEFILTLPKTMVDLMNQLAKDATANKGQLPSDWREYSSGGYASNSTMRDYIKNKYYKGTWPSFSQNIIDRSEELKQIANGKPLYIQPYIYPFTGPDASVTIYAVASESDTWFTGLIFNLDDGQWYRGRAFSITNKTWAENKAIMMNEGWTPITYIK